MKTVMHVARNVTHCIIGGAVLSIFACSSAIGQKSGLTIQVISPGMTPSGSKLYVAGSIPEFGNWRPDGLLMTLGSDGKWVAKVSIPQKSVIEFKITRGSWETEAIYVEGEIAGNTRVTVTSDTIVTLRPVSWRDKMARPVGGIHGTSRYHRALIGEGLRLPRDLVVWLPPSYSTDSNRRFPVLYMHDGQNVFDPATAMMGRDWRADEVADSLIKAGKIEELIIVAINNTDDRMSEYSDTPLGRAYALFVAKTVKPMIDSLYRTRPGPNDTGVMGSSMGGLISFLFTWWHPEVFGKAGCLSSVFSRRYSSILESVSRMTPGSRSIKIYMDCGGAGGDETLKPGLDEMVQNLAHQGFREGSDFIWHFEASAVHNEPAWAQRLWRPLMFMYSLR